MWITTEAGGVDVVDLNGMTEVSDIWSSGMTRESSDMIHAITEDGTTGNIYLGTSNHGILVWDSGTGRIRRSRGKTETGFSVLKAKLVEGEKITKDNCEFIGKIKNGSSLEFEINEEEIIVIAAYDNMNVFMPTDYILIPQGNDNVELTGKVKLNPSKGNPFIFLN